MAGQLYAGTCYEKAEVTTVPKAGCRLHVILARAAPVGVVFRRGPSRWVQVLRWSTGTDVFEAGQWFHGRIYERRCDLSPDGTLLVYFAQKINPRTTTSDYTYAWTAISKLPFLTALALWPKGDCWNGGGLFDSARHLRLNHPSNAATPHPDHVPPRWLRVSSGTFARGEDEPIMSFRAARDGWTLVQDGRFPWSRNAESPRTERPEVWQRAAPGSRASLVKSLDAIRFDAHGGPYVMSYSVVLGSQPAIPIPGANWADWDHSGRLVFARDGSLFAATVHGCGLRETLLADLNPNKPHPEAAPKWATRW